MQTEQALERVRQSGLMAGLRGNFPPETALRVTAVMMEAGIPVFEFLMNSVQPIEAMQAVKREFGDAACVGMGTVLDAATAERALDAGADFIVAPSFSPAVVLAAQARDVLVAPGVLTPTECVDAWSLGVKMLKLFPVGPLGVDYFKAIRGPLDHMTFMCNGGTSDANVGEFLRAGAVACGMGGWLSGEGSTPLETIRQRGQRLVQIVREVRTGQQTI